MPGASDVMMSRHSVACWLVSRGGIEKQLVRHAPVGDRVLGLNKDAEYDGWKAHSFMSFVSSGRSGRRRSPCEEDRLSWQGATMLAVFWRGNVPASLSQSHRLWPPRTPAVEFL